MIYLSATNEEHKFVADLPGEDEGTTPLNFFVFAHLLMGDVIDRKLCETEDQSRVLQQLLRLSHAPVTISSAFCGTAIGSYRASRIISAVYALAVLHLRLIW